MIEVAIALVLGAAGGAAVLYVSSLAMGKSITGRARRDAQNVISEAEREAASIMKEAQAGIREERIELRAEMERESKEQRAELSQLEKRILQKEESIEKKLEQAEQRMSEAQSAKDRLAAKEEALQKEQAKLQEVIEQQKERLEAVSGMTVEEAKREMFLQLENEVKRECSVRLKNIEDELAETANKKAHWILSNAVQRVASDHVSEHCVSVVPLPNDEMKGRIIGREGRNIRAIESATGINVIIDDTPEAIILSGFDPIRREVARIVLTRLISDGRIHPGRVEELCHKVEAEMEQEVKEAGEAACVETNVYGIRNSCGSSGGSNTVPRTARMYCATPSR